MTKPFALPIWVVYDHPKDFPSLFVARLWEGEQATGVVIGSTDIEEVRDRLQSMGLVKLDRMEGDDPKIMETWL